MGARAYRLFKDFQPEPGCLVEIGSERGEGSTAWLYRYAKQHGLSFYTADIDPKATERANRVAPGRARCTTGVKLLRRLRTPISAAYLDGFDWIPPWEEGNRWIRRQHGRYRRLGVELNNENCQQEHLEEARLVAAKANARCMVICDDTFEKDGWHGKGALAVPFLEAAGFTVVDESWPEGKSLGYAVLQR